MTKQSTHVPNGPGETHWYLDEDGCLILDRWNNRGWCTVFASPFELTPKHIPELLQQAYHMGMKDQQVIIRRSLGIEDSQ